MTRPDTHNRILDAALDCIFEMGLTGVTTKAIAAKAGINEVTLFRRFGNKTNLLKAVISREAEQVASHDIRYTGNLEDDLGRVVTGYIELVERRPGLINVLMSELPRHPELMEAFEAPLGILQSGMGMVLRYQMEGKLRPEHPFQTAVSLIAPIIVMAIAQRLLPPEFPRPQVNPVEIVQNFLQGRQNPSPEAQH
ncbi:TetR/AcrR family transcriptional regulator [Deinococcus roseus]|uniref:HTH tetR-type domain-containing protein n=1 Tax=Deinococcus roseus TaxID=392414 RepID=A0ABQ2D053_9DEIO|nr:TetR/AcrR family transcriptional regulator [Deinococcus roseus]GGJ34423.1 hypothetical protein GCM10008938_20750 [Deinococcus roseus]